MKKCYQPEDRATIAAWVKNRDKHIYELISNKYKNYVLTIINRYIVRSGLMNNSYLEADIIFNEVIDYVYHVEQECLLKWDFKTILSHAAIFTTSRYLRNYQTTKQKINLICGNLDETMFEIPPCPMNTIASDFKDTNAEYVAQNVILDLLESTLSPNEKENHMLYEILYLKCSGYSNKEICEQLPVTRKFVYNIYQRWYKKNKQVITELLCLN